MTDDKFIMPRRKFLTGAALGGGGFCCPAAMR